MHTLKIVRVKERPTYSQFIRESAFKHEKMAFIAGARQTGKTTLALQIGEAYAKSHYHTWDDPVFKRQWIKDPKSLVETNVGPKSLLILDELHKAPRWKSHLKGLYDTRHQYADILVIGSAKLDVFRRSSDSLLGRYFLFHLHPFSIGELASSKIKPDELFPRLKKSLPSETTTLHNLMQFGGFPEPYIKKDVSFHRLWQRTRVERLIREDLLSLMQVHDVALIETMAALLPEKVGSLFSLQSICEDLSVSHPTAKRWLEWLVQLYYVYVVPPYFRQVTRSLKKQPKIYMWDWSEVENEAARFENLVGSHLLKSCHFWTDTGQGQFSLFFVRDKEKREADFLITRNKKPWLLVECKMNDTKPDPSLLYFEQMLQPEKTVQLVYTSGVHRTFELKSGKEGFIISADAFLRLLI